MTISNYPNGFSEGVSIREIPIDIRAGYDANVYWVDSVRGSDGEKGNYTFPFATLAYAITQCVADQGDKIYLAAGHAETITAAAGIALNKAGVTIIFCGEGSNKATITFSTLVTATMTITANNVTLVNPRFVAGIDALTGPISITGADCKIINGEWYDAAAKATTNAIVATNAAARLMIAGWKYFASTAGTQKATHIKFADNADAVVRNIYIAGDFSTAPINITAAATRLLLDSVIVQNTNATPKPGIDQHANTTGMAKNVDVRIASGVTFVSSVAKLNWDNNCLGYAADGTKGVLIGT